MALGRPGAIASCSATGRMEHNRGEEFDAAFARIDRVGQDRFDVYWMRHTGRWWRLHAGLTLDEALHVIETDEALHPV